MPRQIIAITLALFVLVGFAATAQAQTFDITQKQPTRGPAGFKVIFSVLDSQSPMGTAVIELRGGDQWVVRYLECDHVSGLSSKREILYRVRKLN